MLQELKHDLPPSNRPNLAIRTYDLLSNESIIIIDRDTSNRAWIQIEDRPKGSGSNNRPSKSGYRKHNKNFFEDASNKYDEAYSASTWI